MIKSLLLLAFMIVALPVSAQTIHPSAYVGIGTGTNLGGLVGAGVELGVGDHLSVSAAIGLARSPESIAQDRVAGFPFGFDVGLKGYLNAPNRAVRPFVGLNYGLIDASYSDDGFGGWTPLESTYGASFTGGVRVPVGLGMHATGYAGLTSSSSANKVLGDFFPRLGVMVGYSW